MNNPTFDTFFTTLEDIGRAIARSVKYAVGAISTMSWPALAITSIMLALIVTIVPLVVGLFLVFMAIKLVFGCVTERATRGPATPHRDVPVATPSDDIKGE